MALSNRTFRDALASGYITTGADGARQYASDGWSGGSPQEYERWWSGLGDRGRRRRVFDMMLDQARDKGGSINWDVDDVREFMVQPEFDRRISGLGEDVHRRLTSAAQRGASRRYSNVASRLGLGKGAQARQRRGMRGPEGLGFSRAFAEGYNLGATAIEEDPTITQPFRDAEKAIQAGGEKSIEKQRMTQALGGAALRGFGQIMEAAGSPVDPTEFVTPLLDTISDKQIADTAARVHETAAPFATAQGPRATKRALPGSMESVMQAAYKTPSLTTTASPSGGNKRRRRDEETSFLY